MKPHKPSWFKKIFGSLFSLLIRTLILFAILEICLRMFGVKPHIALINPEGPFMVHAFRKWALKPNFNGEWSGVNFQTNSFGFRDDEIEHPKSVHEFRILTLGGSITTGYGVEHSQTYVSQLHELLQRTQVRITRVINTGVPGYAPFQYINLLRETGLDLHPDLIILDFSVNDVVDKKMNLKAMGGKGEFRGGGAFLRFDPEHDATKRTKQFLEDLPKYSSLYTAARWVQYKYFSRYLARRQANQEIDLLKTIIEPSNLPPIEAAWNDTKGDVLKVVQLARDHNIPVVILMFPLKIQVDFPHGHDRPQEIMEEFCQENQLPFLNLLPAFRDKAASDGNSHQLFLDNDHPTVTGHNIAAVTLHRMLTPLLIEKPFKQEAMPTPSNTPEHETD